MNFRDEVVIYNLENSVSQGYSSVTDLNNVFENKVKSPSVKVMPKILEMDFKLKT